MKKKKYGKMNILNYILTFAGLIIFIFLLLNILKLNYTLAYLFMILVIFILIFPNFIYKKIISPYLIEKNWHKKIYNVLNTVLIVISVITFIIIILFIVFNINSSRLLLPENKDDSTVIVLGAGIVNGKPAENLKKRLDSAGAYLMENKNANCIVSGGLNQKENLYEADVMKNYLIEEYNINENRIFKESGSTDTNENLMFSYNIAKENSLSKNIVIVTNDFHMFRSIMFAKHYGFINVYSIPVKTNFILLTSFWFREFLSMVKTFIIVYL